MRIHQAVLAFATVATIPVAAQATGMSLQQVAVRDGYTTSGVELAQATSADPAPTGRAAVPVQVESQGSIVVNARVVTGRHALSVDGIAPRNARVTLTLFATLAPDLPTVFLRRNDLQADVNGRFAAVVPLAPDYFAGSSVTLYATSEGVQSGAARVVLDGAL